MSNRDVSVAAVAGAMRERLAGGLGFLEELVRVNSFTGNAAGVNENGRIVAERFAALGFKARRVQCAWPGAGEHPVLDSGGAGPVVGMVSHPSWVHDAWASRPRHGVSCVAR